MGVSKWFVYCGATYYPWGEVVEAATVEEALRAADVGIYESVALVFPWDSVAYNRAGEEPIA